MRNKRLKEDIIKSEEACQKALAEELRYREKLEAIIRMKNEELRQARIAKKQKDVDFEDLEECRSNLLFENEDLRRKMELQERELEVSRDLRKILLRNKT